jgi:hypothetical protein
MDGIDLRLCPVVGFGISGIDPSGPLQLCSTSEVCVSAMFTVDIIVRRMHSLQQCNSHTRLVNMITMLLVKYR